MRDFWMRRLPLILSGIMVVVYLSRADVPRRAPLESLTSTPAVTAAAWAILDGRTGAIVAGHQQDTRRAIASTTKIMTARLVLGLAAASPAVLDQRVEFSERAARTIGTRAGLDAGDSITVRELLYGLMLPSGNDAATAFAEHFGKQIATPTKQADLGGENQFVAAMNHEAERLGLTETHYLDPHGLGMNLSTAKDLARLARACFENPLFRTIVNTREYTGTIRNSKGEERAMRWQNTNQLLEIEGYDGVKTGTTNAAGACLVSSARRGDDHLFIVVLGATSNMSRYADSRNLYRWAWLQRGHMDPPRAVTP
jgi:D-alanyl-D-alanine carboxypeptidase (penicillin-binding protein 5/6)